MIAHNPLHGSGQAGFPHPALALGSDAMTAHSMDMFHPELLPDVLAPAHCSHLAGTESGARFAGAGSPWPVPFPPPPPPPVARLCSAPSSVLWGCPTSWVRSSSACVLRLPDAARRSIGGGRTQDLPVLVRSVSVHARGLRPRGTRAHLAIAMRPVVPSDYPYSVGIPDQASFAAQYPACTYPCQRFSHPLAGTAA